MNQQEFDEVVNSTIQDIQKLLTVKGGEYAGSEDRLGNFKRGAQLTGVSPLQVLFIYLSKHYDAFATFVRDEASGTERTRSESITGRLDDIINYCILAKGLVRELEQRLGPSQVAKAPTNPAPTTIKLGNGNVIEVLREPFIPKDATRYLYSVSKEIPEVFHCIELTNGKLFAKINGTYRPYVAVWEPGCNYDKDWGFKHLLKIGAFDDKATA